MKFTAITPREASFALLRSHRHHSQGPGRPVEQLPASVPDGGDSEPRRRILNRWVEEFLRTADRLKKRNLVEFAKILRGQLDYMTRT